MVQAPFRNSVPFDLQRSSTVLSMGWWGWSLLLTDRGTLQIKLGDDNEGGRWHKAERDYWWLIWVWWIPAYFAFSSMVGNMFPNHVDFFCHLFHFDRVHCKSCEKDSEGRSCVISEMMTWNISESWSVCRQKMKLCVEGPTLSSHPVWLGF